MLFDEATSALDPDRVIFMNAGQIVEEGMLDHFQVPQ